ncbi:MAG: histidine phosphatase family protein [Actinomycetia bacterium]|nr:histidine phosphatase family protein [Actinomycetes bacterium]MCP4958626.1 histidine phosphatase family protein [Actinomycetes bacterium]
MTELLIVRHGESEWNATGRWQGQANPPLSARGQDEARGAAGYLAQGALGDFDAIWSSDLDRAFHTARCIAEALAKPIITTHTGLRERFAGPWEGLTRTEIEDGWPGFLERFERPEGYEDDEAMLARLLPALDEIASRVVRAVVVSHGGVIRTLERHLGAPEDSIVNLASRLFVNNGAGWRIAESHELAKGRDTGLE